MLIELSVPLFIFAATVCRIFDDDNWDPLDSLTQIISHRSEQSKLAPTAHSPYLTPVARP
jgi:hypothetical protein